MVLWWSTDECLLVNTVLPVIWDITSSATLFSTAVYLLTGWKINIQKRLLVNTAWRQPCFSHNNSISTRKGPQMYCVVINSGIFNIPKFWITNLTCHFQIWNTEMCLQFFKGESHIERYVHHTTQIQQAIADEL